MKGGVHLNCREIVGVKFQPVCLWQISRIESTTPVVKAPRACSDAYLLLIDQIQNEIATLAVLCQWKRVQFCKYDKYSSSVLTTAET
jgi:hypothetical protein